MEKNNKKTINAWAMYDWANSVYNLVIGSTIFPAFYIASTRAKFNGDMIDILGMHISNTVAQTYTYSLSYLILCITTPLLSGIADYSGRKKLFMHGFVLLGSLACVGLFFFTGDNVVYGLFMMLLASVGWGGSLVFYNSFLPEIATPDQYDRVSAKGFTMGYIGSVLLLLFNLSMVLFPQIYFDVDGELRKVIAAQPHLTHDAALQIAKDNFGGIASRIAFLTVGVWWFGFSQYSFYYLKEEKKESAFKFSHLKKGVHKLLDVIKRLQHLPEIKKYLSAYFFYNTGVQTVMVLAASFGAKVLNLPTATLIGTILIIQIVAIGGAYIFALISNKKGNINAIIYMVIIWIGVCIGALLVNSATTFMMLAAVVGIVMGGIQSLSRATYGKLIPANDTDLASFFSFLDVLEKLGLVLGTAIFAFTENLTGSMRMSVYPVMVFFIIGLILLRRVKLTQN
ncbi:MAG: MFS transporter [Bacteroidetes bacterium]|nr:MFS transporter [Bacteroidota bacterium]